MKVPHVIFPVFSNQQITSKYDQVLSYLNQRHAVVHLVSAVQPMVKIYGDSKALISQQKQMQKMTQFLKYETLDRQAAEIQSRFPSLTFEFHVEQEPLVKTVRQVEFSCLAQLIVLDGELFEKPNEHYHEVTELVSQVETAIWAVRNTEGQPSRVLTALDIPTNNIHADRDNRVIVSTAANIAEEAQSLLVMFHGWTRNHEQFLKKWLRLNDIDIARIARSDKQHRLSYLEEYAKETALPASQIRCEVTAVESTEDLVEACNEFKPSLIVTGFSSGSNRLLGQTTRKLVANSSADVLVIPIVRNPSEFFSPLGHNFSEFNTKEAQ